jgi:hypothetical protein
MGNSKSRTRKRSYIAGEKGVNRVRLYPHPRDGILMVEYRDEAGAKKRISLRHDDLERGKAAAEKLAAELRSSERPRTIELTLKALFDNYEREVTPTKNTSKQAHDRRTRRLFETCWGAPAKVNNLDRRDWYRFIQQRRSGALRHAGDDRKKKGVRDRVIEYDLRFLRAVCNWAETVRVYGQPLLAQSPFKGFPLPVQANARRPVPSPKNSEQPVRRDVLGDAWQELEKAAKLERIPGRGWHSLRRKFATDLKHSTPLADLCSLGGWKGSQHRPECYMRPDEATMRAALARRGRVGPIGG